MRFSIVPRQVTIAVHPDKGARYSATVQATIYGSRAWFHSLTGEDFYKCMSTRFDRVMRQLKVTEVEALVEPAHVRLIRHSFRRLPLIVTECGDDVLNGARLKWISILLV